MSTSFEQCIFSMSPCLALLNWDRSKSGQTLDQKTRQVVTFPPSSSITENCVWYVQIFSSFLGFPSSHFNPLAPTVCLHKSKMCIKNTSCKNPATDSLISFQFMSIYGQYNWKSQSKRHNYPFSKILDDSFWWFQHWDKPDHLWMP